MFYYTAARSLAKKKSGSGRGSHQHLRPNDCRPQSTRDIYSRHLLKEKWFNSRTLEAEKAVKMPSGCQAPRQLSIKQILKSLNAAKRRFFLKPHQNSTKKTLLSGKRQHGPWQRSKVHFIVDHICHRKRGAMKLRSCVI